MGLGLKILVGTVFALAVIVILGSMMKSRHGLKGFILTALQGIIAIFAVNTAGLVTGVTIAVNWYTLGFGMLCGTPAVVALLIMDTMF
jgi:hypothetical protein